MSLLHIIYEGLVYVPALNVYSLLWQSKSAASPVINVWIIVSFGTGSEARPLDDPTGPSTTPNPKVTAAGIAPNAGPETLAITQ